MTIGIVVIVFLISPAKTEPSLVDEPSNRRPIGPHIQPAQ
jgi:hypothetical protein